MNNNVLTFIMAGGRGERLFPLTRDRTKPAVPFGGIYRIIDFTLSNCLNSGLRKINVLIQYKSHSLQRHIRLGWNVFDLQLGEYIDIIPAQQRIGSDWYQGTADAIYQNIYTIEQEKADYILILAGDHIYKMDYQKMLNFHKERQAEVIVGVVEIPKEQTVQFGVAEIDSQAQIISFKEKPKQTTGSGKIFASMGIYIFNRDVLEEELTRDAEDETSEHDFGKNIIPLMLKHKRRVFSYHFKEGRGPEAGYWRDIGTIDAYYEANMDLVSVDPIFNLYDKDWPIRTFIETAPPMKTVFSGVDDPNRVGVVLDSLVSGGCVISGGKVQRSVLSPNVRINSFSEVYDSILMEGVNVGRYAKIKRAIVDKDVDIPQEATIGYNLEEDKKHYTVTESGIVVVAKRTHID